MFTGLMLGRVGLYAAACLRRGLKRVQSGRGQKYSTENSSVTPTKGDKSAYAKYNGYMTGRLPNANHKKMLAHLQQFCQNVWWPHDN